MPALAQAPPARRTPEEFGYRHLVVMFGKDSVDVLVLSKQGEEKMKRPLLLWCQGSLPTPLLMYDQLGPYPVFPFKPVPDAVAVHLVIISKPGIPLVADVQGLNPNRVFSERMPPAYYCQRNYLDYYVRRDIAVLRFLKKQPWVDARRVVVAGHSEGSTVAAHLAAVPGLVSRAVYLSGNPLGRMMSIVALDRQDNDTAALANAFRNWQSVVANPTRTECTTGDGNRNTYSFAAAPLPVLLRIKVPVFVGYGTCDRGVAGDDYLRLECIRLHKTNFTFREYLGREHNFFRLTTEGKLNYEDDYWPVVGRDFLRWAGLLHP